MPALAVVSLVMAFASAVQPLGYKVLADGVASLDRRGVVIGAVVSGSLIAVGWVASAVDGIIGFTAADRMYGRSSSRIVHLLSSTDEVDHLDRPEIVRDIEIVNQQRGAFASAPRNSLASLSGIARGVLVVGLLATVRPLLAALVVMAAAPNLAQVRAERIRRAAEDQCAERQALADMLFALAADPTTAMELRLCGLATEFEARHAALGREIARRTTLAAVRGLVLVAIAWVFFVSAFVGGLAWVVSDALAGRATIGDVLLVALLVQLVHTVVAQVTAGVARVRRSAGAAARLIRLQDLLEPQEPNNGAMVPSITRARGLRLSAVGFTYPGADRPVLVDVDLELHAGTCVAIVGENGSGKTTLVKLLTRLYRPTAGTITVGGTALDDVGAQAWREHLSAAFQDATRFELSAGQVVGVGDLPNIDSRHAVDDAIERAGAKSVVDRLPAGTATLLGASFSGGRDLSGGQWQMLALARAMMRPSPLMLILDEPTASLDAEAEDALVRRYLDAARRVGRTTGAITLFISHRLATVKEADLIVLLSNGCVREVGSHADLLAAGGEYAEWHALQSAIYQS